MFKRSGRGGGVAPVQLKRIGPWRGMNEKVAPDTLPAGVAADLQNVLLDEIPGMAVTRQGSRKLTALPSGLPPRDSYVFTKRDGTAYFLVSDGVNLYYSTDLSGAYTLIVGSLNSDGFMDFETAENKVWMTNGVDPVMSWDGTTLLTYNRTRTVTNASSAVSSTTIQNTDLTEADDYWNGMKLVFTSGANIGTVVTVTDFVAATDTLTFTPAVSGILVGDDFIVGVSIPKGARTRYWDGHLFMLCTPDNQAEFRFHEISDPDTGEVMTIDNPRAWPAENELALNILDQEKLFGISPILRDRVLVAKASGLWRLERDPLTVYRLELVSRAIGSRFPDTWAEKNGLLYFLGQERDSYPDVYKTDMLSVVPVDPDGGVEPTLRALRQPNAVQSSRTFTSQADFDTGTKSTGALTASGQLGISPSLPAYTSGASTDTALPGGLVGYNGLLGNVNWTNRYDAATNLTPVASSPVWAETGAWAAAGGVLSPAGSGLGENSFSRTGVFASTDHSIMSVRVKVGPAGSTSFYMRLANGARTAWFSIYYDTGAGLWRYGWSGDGGYTASGSAPFDTTDYRILTLQLLTDGTFKFWVDGTLTKSGTGYATSTNEVRIAASTANSFVADPALTTIARVATFTKAFWGAACNTGVPNTIPVTGNFVVQYDFTRAPVALRRFYYAATLHGATVTLESWTSDSSDFSTGNDAAGYLAFNNGDQPTSAIKRYMRVRVTITTADIMGAPDITAVYAGMLWLSPGIQVGSNIGAWRTFLATLVTPAGTAQTIHIRRATTAAAPAEGDYGSWFALASGDNIGTILADGTPPSSRWVQLKVEQGPSSAGAVPYVDSLLVQWNEGSSGNLPVRAVVHKKRYWITAASSVSSVNDTIIVVDRNDQWTKFSGLGLNGMLHYKGNLYGLDAGDAKVAILDLADVYNDDGAAIDAFLITREEGLGAPQLRKNCRYSYLHGGRSSASWTLTTAYKRSGDSDFTGSGTFTVPDDGRDVRQNFPVGTVAKTIQRRYRCNTLDQKMALVGETFYYDVRPEQP